MRTTLQNLAHAAGAVIGVLLASAATIVTVLGTFGVHVTEARTVEVLGAVGLLMTMVSKAIDSAHNAYTTKNTTQ